MTVAWLGEIGSAPTTSTAGELEATFHSSAGRGCLSQVANDQVVLVQQDGLPATSIKRLRDPAVSSTGPALTTKAASRVIDRMTNLNGVKLHPRKSSSINSVPRNRESWSRFFPSPDALPLQAPQTHWLHRLNPKAPLPAPPIVSPCQRRRHPSPSILHRTPTDQSCPE